MNLQPLFDRLLMRWQIAELRVTPKYVQALKRDPRTALTAGEVMQVRSVLEEAKPRVWDKALLEADFGTWEDSELLHLLKVAKQ